MAVAKLRETAALSVMLPWLVTTFKSTSGLMGDHFWPYGIAKNRITIEKLIRYHHTQGLSSKQEKIEELFAKGTLDQYAI